MDYPVRNSNEILKQIQYLFIEYSKAKEYEDNQIHEQFNYLNDENNKLKNDVNMLIKDITDLVNFKLKQEEKSNLIAEILLGDKK